MPATTADSLHGCPTKQIDHAEYPKLCRTRSDAELRFIIADCRSTLAAWPDQPNYGYYLDEINYCADELARRARGGRRKMPTADQIAMTSAALNIWQRLDN